MGFNIVIAARREREFSYKMKVLEKIVEETNGKFLSLTPEHEEVLFGASIHNDYVARAMRLTGSMNTSFGHFESFALMKKVIEAGEKCFADNVKPGGKFAGAGPEGFWGWPTEGRHWWQENAFVMDPKDSDALKATGEYMMKSFDVIVKAKGGLGILPLAMGPRGFEHLGPSLSNCHEWMRKIKNVFDPENASDHTSHISPEPLQLPPEGPGLG